MRARPHVAGACLVVVLAALVARSGESPKPASTAPAAPASIQAPEFPAESLAYFDKKVLPLLQARCFECHGPEVKSPKGGLLLSSRAGVLKGGESGAAAVPGKPDESLLIEAIHYRGFEMPPRSRLPDGEIAILTKWVELGIPWTKGADRPIAREGKFPLEERKASHWSWQPIRHHEAPPSSRPGWDRSPIDRFIVAKLAEKGLDPASEADRRTLIRRATFALIGLPPTAGEVEAFVNDSASDDDAFAAVVDRLLASPHFGERWGRHWLDLVRYAETLGHEFDYPLHYAHQYRDYVVRAFNADVPYSDFVREHIAGDLIANPRLHPAERYNESLIGTGFWFLGEDKHSPVDVRGEEAARFDNQIDVFAKAFLGLTVACARCHDHKFDAISQRDYYALAGFLKSSRRQVGLLDPQGKISEAARRCATFQSERSQKLIDAAPKPDDSSVAQFSRSLAAAREALYGEPKPDDAKSEQAGKRPDILFDDFERDTWGDRWTADGAAFGKGPPEGTLPRQQAVTGFEGKRLVNSYVGGDGPTGKLTSKSFVIDRTTIRFLIGGGAHAGSTCLNLIVNDKVVRTATGKENEKLEPAGWDVREFQGELGILQMVDKASGGWGHVNVDQIVFSDGDTAVPTQRPIAVVAAEHKVERALLAGWVQELTQARVKDASHPLSTWVLLAGESSDEKFREAKRKRAEFLRGVSSRLEKFSTVFEDFNRGDYSGWFVTGEAFRDRSTGPRESNPDQPGLAFAPAGTAHSGLLSPKLCGVLRSKTFTLTHPQILYRVAGKNAQIRLIIDGYQMDVFNALLFGGVSFRVDKPELTWHTQSIDAAKYLGHRCHIELIDDGDGWLAVDEIRFADGGGPPEAAPHPLALRLTADESITTLDGLTAAYQQAWVESLKQWNASDGKSVTADSAALVRWTLESRLAGEPEKLAAFDRKPDPKDDPRAEIPAPMRVVAIADGTPEDEWLLIRGSHKNPGPAVPRRMLEAIGGNAQPAIAEGSGRLALADRLLDPSNPYPARVFVNRVWHHLFGRGFVPSVDNFGVLGEKPTHPKLLDRLAEDFQQEGWRPKPLIRRIVLSKAWRMASTVNEKANDIDPQNLLLHRQNLHRLEGEAIRDALLVISGRFDPTTYGPSVPVHLTPHMQGRGRPGGGPLDGAGRRSLYTSVNRNFLPPMMLAFDTPIPFTTMGRRNVSNVPAQALILMNDPFVIEQSQLWAKRSLAQPASPDERIDRLYRDAFARPSTEDERTEAVAFLKAQGAEYELPADAWMGDERVWADLCHVLVNVKEFIFVN